MKRLLMLPAFAVVAVLGFSQAVPGDFYFSGQNLYLTTPANNFNFNSSQADMDGDGDVDLIFGGYCSRQGAVWLNDGSGNFTVAIPFATTNGNDCDEQIEVGDVDGDGDIDVVVTRPLRVYKNDGSGNLTLSFTCCGNAVGITLADIDGDSDLDGVFGVTGGLQVYKNDGTGAFTFFSTANAPGGQNNRLEKGDFDGDGDMDVVLAQRLASGTATKVYFNDGAGNMSPSVQDLGFSSYNEPAVANLNGDNFLDIVTTNNTAAPSEVWLNDGTGTFINNQSIAAGAVNLFNQAADLDNDGDLDLFLGNNGPNHVWFNDGAGNFTDSGQNLGSCNTWGLELADFNGDGFMDAAASNISSPAKIWWNNIYVPTPTLCPADIQANEQVAGDGGANVYFTAGTPGNVCNATVTYSHAPGSFFPLGTTAVTVTYQGNSCVFNITVAVLTPVPTLGQWGLITLGLLIACFGVVKVFERRNGWKTA